MDALVDSMNRLCDDGLDSDQESLPHPPEWLQRTIAYDRAEAVKYRKRLENTTEDERAQRLLACTDCPTAGFDTRGRPTLRGIVPDRRKIHRSHAPRRESAMQKVIKHMSKVKVSDT